MRTPKYYVSLGGINLHQVTSFGLSSSRDIDDYDGVGSGKFNVPGSQAPREWTIECTLLQNGKLTVGLNTWSASELFKEFEAWLGKTDEPVRMVKTDSIYPAANLSVLVWLKSYTQKETDDQGVYDVEITVAEYKPVGIKTTGIPTVSRPGKVPIPPKVTITKTNSVYKATKKATGSSATATGPMSKYVPVSPNQKIEFKDTKTGKPISNPCVVKEGSQLVMKEAPKPKTLSTPTTKTLFDGITSSFKAIGTAIGNFFTGKG